MRFAALLFVIFCSYSTPILAERTMEIRESKEQVALYDRGEKCVFSDKRCSIAILPGIATMKNRSAAFSISVVNNSDAPTNVGTENVKIFDQFGRQIPIKKKQEVLDKEKSSQFWQGLWLGFCTGCNSYNASRAGESSYNGSVNTYGNGSSYHTNYYGQANSEYLKYQAQRQASKDNAALMRIANSSWDASEGKIRNEYLDTTTVFPGNQYDSYFEFTIPRNIEKEMTSFRIVIFVGCEEHVFFVECQEVKRRVNRAIR